MKKLKNRTIFFIIFILLGIVMAMQFKSTLYIKLQSAAATYNTDRLKEQLSREQKNVEKLKEELDGNLKLREDYIKAFIDEENDYQLARDWDKVKFQAGFTDVKGPGITITMDDAPARDEDTPQNLLIIHDQDMKILLNDLKKAGAQAISVNGERLSPMSEVICAGPNILINGNRYPVPYVIQAIGDADLLFESINSSERIALMREDKIRIEIIKSNEVLIPKFSGIDHLSRLISGLEVVQDENR